MKKVILLICFLTTAGNSQSYEEVNGNVSFISSQNIYVRFSSTEGIKEGDTLFVKNNSPAVLVKFLSSTSAAGELINGTELKTGDEVFARIAVRETIADDNFEPVQENQTNSPVNIIQQKNLRGNERINGRFSIQSYSNFSNSGDDFQRWRYTLAFNGKNIGESPVSAQAYLNFNYKADEWNHVKNNPGNSLRIYDLAVKYDLGVSSFTAGRLINPKITNLGSIDGIQYNHYFGNFSAGVFVGSRPDFSNLGYNIKLFEAGAYLNRSDTIDSKHIDNTLAFAEQTNNFKTDRRLIYFQHTNNYFDELSFFLSGEADLYKKINNISKNELSLTGFFVSARYNPFTAASFNISYDARRNVIYYETFKNILETLLENEMRQGLRGSINIRPFTNFFASINAGYRFRKGDPSPSNDYGGSLNYASIPYIFVTPSVTFTRIKSSYVSGNIFGVMLSRNFDFLNSYISLIYRNADYNYLNNSGSVQNSVSADISARIIKQIYFSVNWEGIYEGDRISGRIFLDLTSRL